ncbi:MAG: hypothetical protein COV72_02925 [Candidatus Omnitrophica bacterium CG11_big_fil_rev_8_21_14_0_20_42_13]|uniref:Four helix bundle protein n=1 Tax=Candidatus Ghiorseimicrobium undicola TaxID=1974746 RepID=A0A2H0LYM3_9BACT|nr:MAG: hypothetical protein COV72_02925 [Candidatus Omnitrophica bacterium CG11_big_fil_rev_8_21_14_0_20_42_13]
MGEKVNKFNDLRIWQEGISLAKEIYELSNKFPDEEKFCLVTQIRRAAISVPSNIAEGFRRKHKKEFIHFLNFALGSLAEIETQLILAKELDYAKPEKIEKIIQRVDYICRMTTTLINRI